MANEIRSQTVLIGILALAWAAVGCGTPVRHSQWPADATRSGSGGGGASGSGSGSVRSYTTSTPETTCGDGVCEESDGDYIDCPEDCEVECLHDSHCDEGETCVGVMCVEATTPSCGRVCDDGDPCTKDECDEEAGCIYTKIETGCPEQTSTWYDSASGLTWQNPPAPDGMHWDKAGPYCASLALDGGGWRLPAIYELRSLIRGCPNTQAGGSCNIQDGVCVSQSCRTNTAKLLGEIGECQGCPDDKGGGPGTGGCFWPPEIIGSCEYVGGGTFYWSSTLMGDYSGKAWYVYFYEGSVKYGYGISEDAGNPANLAVRCVR